MFCGYLNLKTLKISNVSPLLFASHLGAFPYFQLLRSQTFKLFLALLFLLCHISLVQIKT